MDVKQSLSCPKCRGQKLWVIDPFRAVDPVVSGAAVPVVHQREATGRFGLAERVVPQGHFQLWTCDACGYSELWAEGIRGLQPNPAAGIRLVDGSAPGGGPFR